MLHALGKSPALPAHAKSRSCLKPWLLSQAAASVTSLSAVVAQRKRKQLNSGHAIMREDVCTATLRGALLRVRL